jgi:hypothetical protein
LSEEELKKVLFLKNKENIFKLIDDRMTLNYNVLKNEIISSIYSNILSNDNNISNVQNQDEQEKTQLVICENDFQEVDNNMDFTFPKSEEILSSKIKKEKEITECEHKDKKHYAKVRL